MLLKRIEGFILETIMDKHWQLFLSFICFNIAYLIANFPLCSYLLCGTGLALLISAFFDTFSITFDGRAVLITGCDTGFGHELAKKLHAMKFVVFAGCLDVNSNGAIRLKRFGDETGQLHVIQMDVTKQEDVDKALEYTKKNLPQNGLWAIVNNAGQFGSPGCLEWIPTPVYEKVMSVNSFGAIRVTNAFLPLVRKSQGRIVNVSSFITRAPSPFIGSYIITKSVIDSYSATLRLEMKRFNVKVVVIEPGNFIAATNINNCKGQDSCEFRRLWNQLDERIQKDYGEECLEQEISISGKMIEFSIGEPHAVVDAMANAVSRIYPKNRYFVANISDKLMSYAMQYLPLWFTDRLMMAILTKSIPFDFVQYLKYVVLIPFYMAVLFLVVILCVY